MRTHPAIRRDLLGAAVLQVRSGRAVSRSSLSAVLALAPSTVGLYVDQLISDGYLDESGVEQGPVGRPKRRLTPQPGAGWFAGVEFNAERVQAVRVDFAGQCVASQVKWLADEPNTLAVLNAIKTAVAALARNAQGPLLAIGMGAPGIVDPMTGISAHYAFIADWRDVPLADTLRDRFEVPVTVENNIRAIALAERWFGGGRDFDDYVILGPRSGIGIAIVHGGRLMGGARHAAGEIGHWPWPIAGAVSPRVMHDALSAPAIWRRLAGVSARARLPEDLRAALAEFDSATGRSWDEIISDFAHVIACLQLVLDTERFVLHGPLTALGDRFCTAITQAVREQSPVLAAAPPQIIRSALGDDAGALGAASLAMEAWAPVPDG